MCTAQMLTPPYEQEFYEELVRDQQEERELNLIKALSPKFMKEGFQFTFLYGENLRDGLVGFGNTVAEAVADFYMNYHNDGHDLNQNTEQSK